MESNLKIDHDFLMTWHLQYDQLESDEPEYGELVDLVGKEIEEKRTISKETFIRILNWKSKRLKGIVKLDKFNIYEKGITDAYSVEEDQKIIILLRLYGVGPPLGSTILHFMYPNSFPIIDKRTAETLHYAGRIKSRLTKFANYTSFKTEILKIARDNPSLSLRKIDRALFAYHKIILSTKLAQNDERKKIRRKSSISKSKSNLKIKDKVLSIFQDRIGEMLLREEIIDLVVNTYPGTNRSSVIPSDYCYNIVNTGIPFNFHIFESLGKGQYKCLGPNYPYTGSIYWKGEQIGKWERSIPQLWKDPRGLGLLGRTRLTH